MGYTIKKNITIAVEEEITQGTYVDPASGGVFIQALEDGIEMTPSRETLERNLIGQGLSKAKSRAGLKGVTGAIPVEMKAGSAATSAPEYGSIMQSLLGGKRNGASVTSTTGNTTTLLNVASTTGFVAGDIVLVKEAGDYHVSPIASIVTDTSITLLIAGDNAFSDSTVVEAHTTYFGADSGHPALSITKYVEDEIKETAIGCLASSFSLDSFTTGQNATMNFGFEGLDFDREVESIAQTPAYDTSEPPVILNACIFQDGVKIEVNDFTLSVENTIGFIQDTCNGKTASRITDRVVSGTINPYKQDDSVANFTNFNTNADFSLVITASNPTGVDGEVNEVVSFYLPQCAIGELGEADLDGVLQDTLAFSASSDNVLKEIYISIS